MDMRCDAQGNGPAVIYVKNFQDCESVGQNTTNGGCVLADCKQSHAVTHTDSSEVADATGRFAAFRIVWLTCCTPTAPCIVTMRTVRSNWLLRTR